MELLKFVITHFFFFLVFLGSPAPQIDNLNENKFRRCYLSNWYRKPRHAHNPRTLTPTNFNNFKVSNCLQHWIEKNYKNRLKREEKIFDCLYSNKAHINLIIIANEDKLAWSTKLLCILNSFLFKKHLLKRTYIGNSCVTVGWRFL